jgi:PAS domain S-box-containing protein
MDFPRATHATQQFVEQMPIAFAIFDGEMRYRAVSRRHLADLAWLFSTEILPPHKVLGRTFREVSPNMPARWGDAHDRVLAGEDLSNYEDFVLRQDGRPIWVRWIMKPWRNVHGRIEGALLFSELVTETVEIRHSLHQSESRARATFENAAVGISHVTPDGRFLRFNGALSRILGWPADELIAKTVPDITHPDDLAVELAHFKQLEDGKVDNFTIEKRDLRKDGTIVWVRGTVSCVRRSNGSIDYFLSVTEDISARKRAEEELADSEAWFRATFENAAVGIADADSDGKLLRVNKALCRIYGYSAEELLTKSFQEIAHPDDLMGELPNFEQLRDGKIDSYSVERRNLCKDGTFIWIRVTVSCVRKSDGSLDYFVGVIEDISARKRAEEQVHLLMREANHRIKNLLGLVQVIARQTGAGNPEDFVRRFTERVQALAANQDLLGQNQQQGADLEDLVRTQLAHLGDLMGSRIAVDGPKLCLKATAAQAIGLALHELATNAAKYGSLSVGSGGVDVCWCLDGDVFAMAWIERNGPPVSPPKRRGFGSAVVDLMAKRTVDGEVKLDYAPSGLVWRLTCPAVNALEPWERRSNFAAGENRTDARHAKPRMRNTAP